MNDFAIRLWDSENQKMIYINDLYFFKEHGIHTIGDDGNNPRFKKRAMLASSYYDKKNNIRLYENDIVEIYYGFEKEYTDIGIVQLTEHKGWATESAQTCAYYKEIYDFLEKWHYVKIGDVYSNPEIIPQYRKTIEEKREASKRAKEMKCLMKLKAKYDGVEV